MLFNHVIIKRTGFMSNTAKWEMRQTLDVQFNKTRYIVTFYENFAGRLGSVLSFRSYILHEGKMTVTNASVVLISEGSWASFVAGNEWKSTTKTTAPSQELFYQ